MFVATPWSKRGMAINERAPARYVVGGVVRGDLKVVDDAGLIAVNQFTQKPPVESGQLVLLLPGVDVPLPRARSRDPKPRVLKVAAAQGEVAIGGQDLAHPGAVGSDHLLGVDLEAHLAHRLDDEVHPLLPGAGVTFQNARGGVHWCCSGDRGRRPAPPTRITRVKPTRAPLDYRGRASPPLRIPAEIGAVYLSPRGWPPTVSTGCFERGEKR